MIVFHCEVYIVVYVINKIMPLCDAKGGGSTESAQAGGTNPDGFTTVIKTIGEFI